MVEHEKKKLRELSKEILKDISEKSQKERKLSLNLVKVLNQLNPNQDAIIGGFAPLKDEANWPIALEQKRMNCLSFPATGDDPINLFSMNFYLAQFDELKENTDFGVKVLVPSKKGQIVLPEIMLIPGLSFTNTGHRLGRGKGYYDRYLINYSGHRVGICFEEQITNSIPTDNYDQNIHILVTDMNIYHCNQKKER